MSVSFARFYVQSFHFYFLQAGLPPGALNVVSGFGPTAGAAVASHMDIDKVNYELAISTYEL